MESVAEAMTSAVIPQSVSTKNTSTKILATLGPKSTSRENLAALHQAGVNVFRLNFSHGSHADHLQTIRRIRELETKQQEPITIMADLQGPKLRVGKIEEGSTLVYGQRFELHLGPVTGNSDRAQLPHKDIFDVIQVGHRLLVDDGKVALQATEVSSELIITKVIVAGSISSNKGVNVPDVNLPIRSLTEKDQTDLFFALENDINIFALSFVQSADDVNYLRTIAKQPIKIVSKLEKPAALQDLNNIVKYSDAIMVARGDLGVELSPSAVPVAQNRIIKTCRQFGKPVIVATQMLESMTHLPTPTRAEASDVANAVYSGADAVMLSGETAVGAYPVETVRMMKEIIAQAEADKDDVRMHIDSATLISDSESKKISQSISGAVKEIATTLNCPCIASFTTSGSTSISIAQQRPSSTLVALTTSITTAKFLAFVWGTKSIVTRDAKDFDDMATIVCETLLEKNFSNKGELAVITAGAPFGSSGRTNLLRIESL